MKYISKIIKHIYLLILLGFILFPLVYTVLSSFKTNAEILANPAAILPQKFTFDNYIEAWNSNSFPIAKMFFNSTYYTIACVAITLFLSTICGYVFARGIFPGKKVMFVVITALMFVNLGSIAMYPNFEVLDFLHIPKSLPSLLLIKCFGIPVANIFLVRGFIEGIPKEVDEAAKLDGCSFAEILFKIIIHLITPILATIAILTFNGSWNDFLNPMIYTLTRPEQRTLTVGIVQLKSTGEAAASWNLMLAGTTVALIPVLVMYVVCNKYFVQGITEGAVKG